MRKGGVIRSGGRLAVKLLLSALIGAAPALADPELVYQKRGNYREGVRPTPVSGSALELLSFRAAYSETMPTKGLPAQYRIRFLLERPGDAYLTVRELRNVHYYWLDQVTPAQPWKAGGNDFSWSTDAVLSRLAPPLSMADLAVLVRVDSQAPGSKERVAPALIYHSKLPAAIEAYELQIVPGEDAKLTIEVFGPDDRPARGAAEPSAVRRWSGGQPLRIRWPAAGAAAGRYRFKITAEILSTGDRVVQTVEFHHRPTPG